MTQEYVDKKYTDILNIPEDVEDNLSAEFDTDAITVDSVTKELQSSEDIETTKQALLTHIADMTGDIVATSRYESDINGEGYEQHIDNLIETVNSFEKTESENNLVDNNSESKYSIRVPGELRVPLEEIPETIEVASPKTGEKVKAREAIELTDSLIEKLSNVLDCVK